jgi:hypothetical protein
MTMSYEMVGTHWNSHTVFISVGDTPHFRNEIRNIGNITEIALTHHLRNEIQDISNTIKISLTHRLRNEIGSLSEKYSQTRFRRSTVVTPLFHQRISSLMRGLVFNSTHGNVVFHLDEGV